MRILIAGASGFIGTRLAHRLAAEGHDVVAVGRTADRLPVGAAITHRPLDIGDRDGTAAALADVACAYYLVHSLDTPGGFDERDRELAHTFADAAADAGVKRIVYLGGLGSGTLSEHLRSRQEVGAALASTGVEVVELRAAVILGAGSVSFEMMRYLVERLPAMVCPRWVRSPIQPIAVDDVLAYLDRAREVPPGVYEIGGDVTTYRDMMQAYAAARRLPRRVIVDVPLLTLRLSGYWVDLVTPVDRRVSHSLIESLSVPVVVEDPEPTETAFDIEPAGVDVALRAALDDQLVEIDATIERIAPGLRDGVYVVRTDESITDEDAIRIREELVAIGGDLNWYGIPRAWQLRLALGRLIGESNLIERPTDLAPGATVDWWRVVRWDGSTLVLRAHGWRPGEAWLCFEVTPERFRLTAAFRPRGVLGFAYWRLLEPLHRWSFGAMVRHRLRGTRRR